MEFNYTFGFKTCRCTLKAKTLVEALSKLTKKGFDEDSIEYMVRTKVIREVV